MRASIDRLDAAAASILIKRSRVARRVALWKNLRDRARRDPHREAQVRAHYGLLLEPHGWSAQALDTWLATLMAVSASAQNDLRIAFQGGAGSWSHESLLASVPNVAVRPCETFEGAWRSVREGECVAAWLAARNTTIGEIRETLPFREEGEAWLSVDYPVRHALVAPAGLGLEELRSIEGHPRALDQCAKTLAREAPRALLVGSVDGAHSIERLRSENRTAVVGPPSLGERPGWTVLRPCVSDRADNATTFELVVQREVW